jgi:hypothetical protein
MPECSIEWVAGVFYRVGLSLRGNGTGITAGDSSVWGHAFPLPCLASKFCTIAD